MLDMPQIKRFSSIHFSIAADAKNPAVVYVGGQQQPGGLSVLFRIDSTKAPGTQIETFTNAGTAGNTAPHPDSRGMMFDADGNLLEVDDGGIYRRTSPETNTGDWFSMVGNLQITELLSVAFDRNSGIIFGGAQDNGALIQSSTGSASWIDRIVGDSGDVDVDITSRAPNSVRYVSIQSLEGFFRLFYSPSNVFQGDEEPTRTVVGGGAKLVPQGLTPVKVNDINPLRIVIGGQNAVYESADQGDTITQLSPPIKANSPGTVVYGGRGGARVNFKPNADVLYVGSLSALYKRTAPPPAELIQLTAYPGTATITGVTVNPRNYDEVCQVARTQATCIAVLMAGLLGATSPVTSQRLMSARFSRSNGSATSPSRVPTQVCSERSLANSVRFTSIGIDWEATCLMPRFTLCTVVGQQLNSWSPHCSAAEPGGWNFTCLRLRRPQQPSQRTHRQPPQRTHRQPPQRTHRRPPQRTRRPQQPLQRTRRRGPRLTRRRGPQPTHRRGPQPTHRRGPQRARRRGLQPAHRRGPQRPRRRRRQQPPANPPVLHRHLNPPPS